MPALAVLGTLLFGFSLWWNLTLQERDFENSALTLARTNLEKDIFYRRWNPQFGGVYVPVGPYAQPNPYLKVPEREIETLSGRRLTLVNPAYMTRQVHELEAKGTGIKGHITSLNPIRPGNAPDPWEREALQKVHGRLKKTTPSSTRTDNTPSVCSSPCMWKNPACLVTRPRVTKSARCAAA